MVIELKKYLKATLGVEVDIKSVPKDRLGQLPLYFKNEYNMYQMIFFGKELFFIEVENDFTTDKLKKHLNIIRDKLNTPAVAIVKQLESYKRIRLIEKKISFIMPGRQMYMPELLIDLKEFGIIRVEKPKLMTPATQCLLLYHLLFGSLEDINLKSIAKQLSYDSATITRCSNYLSKAELCTVIGTKEKALHFQLNKRELWEKAEPLMRNPIKKTLYYNGWVNDENLLKTNNNALAYHSDLNDDTVKYFAVKPGYSKFLEGANIERAAAFEGHICIEEWSYDPLLLSNNGFVDPLSLYLCYRDSKDERIEMALEQIINNIEW